MLKSVTGGLWDIRNITSPEKAYITLIVFAKDAELLEYSEGRKFIVSIKELTEEYNSFDKLYTFLSKKLEVSMNNIGTDSTNITNALHLSKEIHNTALCSESFKKYGYSGKFYIKKHSVMIRSKSADLLPPLGIRNIRSLLYSDGKHNAETIFDNPYKSDELSTLITIFHGNENDEGAKELEEIACICPIHGKKGHFVFHKEDQTDTIRNLFRMASGTSGFCPECIR